MKPHILAAILCFFAVNLFTKPNSSAAKDTNNSTAHATFSLAFKNNQEPATNTEAPKASPPKWYASSEWWLVVIAGLTGLAIVYQAREMARATKVMEGQLALQKAAMQQWVEVENWNVTANFPGIVAIMDHKVLDCPDAIQCVVTFDIVNPASLPLTVLSVHRQVTGGDMQVSSGMVLPPRKVLPVDLRISLAAEQPRKYFEDVVIVTVIGWVF